ncbi:ArsR/SmtB family transcription factor [Cylindrospermopsis curvispora]|uniref:Winged helix-turn-helix transcriptional regulator n=1 Tax=Cylindrospermopsis curvispora GIHE-G1 TaxID=2666332 RepID=A0A7H0F079_9CYAN|nr:metalloregulator ArsR/SmtB family transcription factor [Cylindrospermopsis curvispora]QNP29445.1 winged helix-turn-helix transcriptional regulator [Cylindrospermopsis curvispora GIHE-G1]
MPTSLHTTSYLMAQTFHALSDPIRIAVIELLRHRELCVCDLCNALGISQSKLSFHLKILKQTSLVVNRQEGRWIYYSLNLGQFQILEQYLQDIRVNSPVLPLTSFCE